MANEMTAREQRFAALLLETTKVEAYRQAGYSQKGSRATLTVDAYRLSKRPKVQREVARLLRQRAFPADDYKRIQETVIARWTEIFLHDPDSRVRLRVGERLLQYADAGLKLHPPPSPKELDESRRDQLVAELRALYQRELPNSTYKPLVEAEDEPPAASAAELLEEIRRPVDVEVPEQPAPQVRYVEKCISKPGHFPPRFVRIAVRNPPSPDAN